MQFHQLQYAENREVQYVVMIYGFAHADQSKAAIISIDFGGSEKKDEAMRLLKKLL